MDENAVPAIPTDGEGRWGPNTTEWEKKKIIWFQPSFLQGSSNILSETCERCRRGNKNNNKRRTRKPPRSSWYWNNFKVNITQPGSSTIPNTSHVFFCGSRYQHHRLRGGSQLLVQRICGFSRHSIFHLLLVLVSHQHMHARTNHSHSSISEQYHHLQRYSGISFGFLRLPTYFSVPFDYFEACWARECGKMANHIREPPCAALVVVDFPRFQCA